MFVNDNVIILVRLTLLLQYYIKILIVNEDYLEDIVIVNCLTFI